MSSSTSNLTLRTHNAETINESKQHLQSLLIKETSVNANTGRKCLTELIQKFPSFALSRSQAIDWLLKVHNFHSFSASTIVLAVNYFDRFFARFGFHECSKSWMIHLTAVACLSLAAKMEETHVPLLVDFQVVDAKYVFEAKTIQKTEILILSTLDWEMNAATPISFLEHLIIISGISGDDCFSMCADVLLQALTYADYLNFRPSVVAAAAILIVASELEPCVVPSAAKQISDANEYYDINKLELNKCCSFLQRLLSKCCRIRNIKHGFSTVQDSPKGVLDELFNSDDDSFESSSSLEPVSKRTKLHENQESNKNFI